MQYFTDWTGLTVRTWEHKVELEQYGDVVLKYWADQPEQKSGGNFVYRRYRVEMAKWIIANRRGERHVHRNYCLCCDVRGRPHLPSKAMIGAFLYFKPRRAGWQFARVVQVNREKTRVVHTLKLLDLGKNINVTLDEGRLTTDNLVQEPGTWCWHAHRTNGDV